MELARGLPQSPQVIRRPFRSDGLPGLFDEHQAEGIGVGAHLPLESVDDAEGAEGIEGRVHLRDGVHLEDDKARREKVRRVTLIQKEREPAGLPVRVEGDKEGTYVKDRGSDLDPADDIRLRLRIFLPGAALRGGVLQDPRTDFLPDEAQEILENRVLPLRGKAFQEVGDDAEEDGVRCRVPSSFR